ncbi:DMT family transporter [Sinisalibacter aestuarii]|uniref:Peptide ABC transporter permease n=1 Tax=Sinisalibacter aestuarii TaxID=2949426 RepID=A0ABQ5LTW4_9RHOB|nr:DMT family transporter [Sinisalibacter aestuarii]GKY88359.1 peptide ABC transporter permease [Sinisalibacter aestuarii]
MAETTQTAQANRPLVGVLWMLVTGLCFVMVTALVKHVGGRIPAAETAFLRYFLGLVFLVPMLRPLFAARLDRRMIGLFSLRGAAHALGVILWFYAMAHIPMAEVTALNFMNPVYVTLGAALLFGERIAARRFIAIVAALVGGLIILRPGFRTIEPGHYAMIGTALLFAASYLIAGRLAARVKPVVVVAMLSITVTIGLAPFAAANWVTPTPTELFWLFGVAAFATAGHYTMTLAFASAPMAVTQPVTFLQLVWSVVIGALFFGEPADHWVIFGGAIIISAVSFIAWREAVLKRRVTPAMGEPRQ